MKLWAVAAGIALLLACDDGEPDEVLYSVHGEALDCEPLPIDGPFAVTLENAWSERPDAMTLSWGHVGVRCGDLGGVGCLPGRVEQGDLAYTVFLEGSARGDGMELDVAIQRDCLDADAPCPDRCRAVGTRRFERLHPQATGQLPEPDGSCEELADAVSSGAGEAMQIEVYNLAGTQVRMSALAPTGAVGSTTLIFGPYARGVPYRESFEVPPGNLWEITSMDGVCLRRFFLHTPLYVIGGQGR